jgi:hypothetical protein
MFVRKYLGRGLRNLAGWLPQPVRIEYGRNVVLGTLEFTECDHGAIHV